jgi:LysM repeat protein
LANGPSYTVQPGDTLSGIAEEQLGDANRWPEIFVLNRGIIRDPNRISPGQVLTLPGDTPIHPPPRLYTVRQGATLSASQTNSSATQTAGPRSSSSTGK